MPVEDGDEPQCGGTPESSRSMWLCAAIAVLPCAARRGPAGVEPIGGGDREQPDVAPVLRHQPDRLDRLRRHRAGVGDDDLARSAPGFRSQ